MAWKHCTANYLFFPTYVDSENERELLRFLERRHDLDFGDYSDRGGGFTNANLRWGVGEEVTFEGVGTDAVTLTGDLSPERVLAEWRAFCDLVHAHCATEAAERRADGASAHARP